MLDRNTFENMPPATRHATTMVCRGCQPVADYESAWEDAQRQGGGGGNGGGGGGGGNGGGGGGGGGDEGVDEHAQQNSSNSNNNKGVFLQHARSSAKALLMYPITRALSSKRGSQGLPIQEKKQEGKHEGSEKQEDLMGEHTTEQQQHVHNNVHNTIHNNARNTTHNDVQNTTSTPVGWFVGRSLLGSKQAARVKRQGMAALRAAVKQHDSYVIVYDVIVYDCV